MCLSITHTHLVSVLVNKHNTSEEYVRTYIVLLLRTIGKVRISVEPRLPVHTYVYTYVHMHIRICICVYCTYVRMYVCTTNIHIHVHTYEHL